MNADQLEIAHELEELADIFGSLDIVNDTGPLYAAASQVRMPASKPGRHAPDRDQLYWGYEIVDLQVFPEEDWKILPKMSVVEKSLVTITVHHYASNEQGGEEAELNAQLDGLRLADIDFRIGGLCQIDGGAIESVEAAWHLDTHLHREPTILSHPKHHFQFGGRNVDHLDGKIRGIMIPDAPRIPSAPLNGVLALDFVVSQYCGEKWARLTSEARYNRLKEASVNRYWKPYFECLSGYFSPDRSEIAARNARKLMPNLP